VKLSVMGWAKETVSTDYLVMASTHVDPVTNVASVSGLEIDASNGGIAVNGLLEAVGGIYAAGACASYYDPALGRRRVDMLDHSINR
jgi:NADPH-dependent 2,4-dienoyl-CoA reductase/sulfur reductase-like enzyme